MEVSVFLMSRFREEVYAKKVKRFWDSPLQGTGDPGNPYVTQEGPASWGSERRALRSEYFKKAAKDAAQATRGARRLDGV